MSAKSVLHLLNTYRVLRTVNPSPYMFYFSGTDVEVAGASPETLVKLENGVLHTFPLAGTRSEITTDLASIVDVVRQNTDVPCAIGFGISKPEQAKQMADIADGAIVGSAIIKLLEQYGKDAPDYVGAYVKSMKDAIR